MEQQLKPPIILLGNTRSGTSVVQNVMSAHPDIVGWYEPNAIWLYPDPSRLCDEFDERDATERVRRYIRGRFLAYQRQYGGRRVLEKSPQNILRIPYVRAVFPEATFAYIVRHPFSFISSVELKWQRTVTVRGIFRRLKSTPARHLPYWFGRYLRQQFEKRVLRRKYLSMWGPRYRGIRDDLQNHDLLTVIARQWSECSRMAEEALAQFAEGEVLRLRYEDFVASPIEHVKRLCDHCGLEMTAEVEEAAHTLVKTDRLVKWQRFDVSELARILPEIQDEMRRHGYEIPEDIGAEAAGQPVGSAPADAPRRAAPAD